MKSKLVSLAFSLAAAGVVVAQGFSLTTPSFAGLTVRPPQLWVDVKEWVDAGKADRFAPLNLSDFSGHGWSISQTNMGGGTNIQYSTRGGGAFTWFGASTGGFNITNNYADSQQLMMFGGKTNTCTIGIRMWWKTGNNEGILQTGVNAPTPNYAYLQIFSPNVLFDFGGGGSVNNRISAAMPSVTWMNVFITHRGTNSTVWMDGTNFVSVYSPCQITNVTSGYFKFFSSVADTNILVKRLLIWDYELPPADIAAWDSYMKFLP